MTITFRPAVREQIGIIVGLAGGTGSGKTYSALRLAKGICGDKPYAVIDTEAGRAKHYADQFRFDHGDLKPPFSPSAYAEAIGVAERAGYPVIVVDSVSHVWAGDGGVLDMHEAELQRMAGDDPRKRDACKMAGWIKPKREHKQMVQQLLQVRAHLILCFRAEEKVEMVRDGGKWVFLPKAALTGLNGWLPVCEKNLPFELTISFLLLHDRPGVPHPIKLQEQHKGMFPKNVLIGEDAGRAIAEWGKGGTARPVQSPAVDETPRAQDGVQRDKMLEYFGRQGVDVDRILLALGKASIEDIDTDDMTRLRGIGRALRDGATTVQQTFGIE
jgi:hypothetical protein